MDSRPADIVSGFRHLRTSDVKEYASKGILLEHERTGCRAYHLLNDDTENLFAFVFRTPPVDNTGTAHILEHTVLSGSKRFCVKDPFIALMKGSVNTFLNAITYPDKTVFPAASTLEKDYFNLLEVYGDSVFFPLLSREVFQQEGCRAHFDDTGELSIDGVVYNEMKGNYSDHDSIVGEWSYRSLFPDSPYRFDSGGEPASIRELTYDRFVEYHRRWYHPSNCLIFLYGNIPTSKSLNLIEEKCLSKFERSEIDTSIPLQRDLEKPIELTLSSPLAADDSPDSKSTISVNWIAGRIDDPYRVLGLEVLSEILLGNPGAPMYKAIQESNLGEDLSPVSGLDTDTRDLVFTFGIRGTDPANTRRFLDLVTARLADLASRGIPAVVTEGALRRVEFRNREIRGGVPFGLRLLSKTLRGWLHGDSPETTLEFEPWMEKLKEDVEKGGFFEDLIRECFLENNNRSTVTVIPTHDHEKRDQEELEKWKNEFLKHRSGAGVEKMKKEKEAFDLYQETPDSPEAVATIPSLSIEDIPRKVENVETRQDTLSGVPFYSLDIFTNGVAYIDFVFDIQDISGELLPLFPLFCRAAVSAGLPGIPYDEVARQLAIETGGFTSFLEVNSIDGYSDAEDNQRSRGFIVFRMKALESNLESGLDIVTRLITDADFSDTRRIGDILLEFRNDIKAQILPAGSSFTSLRAGSRISPVLAREELWKGIEQVLYIYRAADEMNTCLPLICRQLEELKQLILNRNRLTLNLTAGQLEPAKGLLENFVTKLPAAAIPETRFKLPDAEPGPRYEALVVPSMVGYVSTVFPASSFIEREHAHEVIVAQLLKTDFLWEQVRMRGGAYGVSASVNGGEKLFSFSSYRDPNIKETFEAYSSGLDRLAEDGISAGELEKAIIGIVGRDLRPLSPGEKGIIGFRRKLYEISDDLRQRKRDELLRSTPAEISRAAARLRDNLGTSRSVVMAGKEAIASVPEEYSGLRENAVPLL